MNKKRISCAVVSAILVFVMLTSFVLNSSASLSSVNYYEKNGCVYNDPDLPDTSCALFSAILQKSGSQVYYDFWLDIPSSVLYGTVEFYATYTANGDTYQLCHAYDSCAAGVPVYVSGYTTALTVNQEYYFEITFTTTGVNPAQYHGFYRIIGYFWMDYYAGNLRLCIDIDYYNDNGTEIYVNN